MNITQYVIDKVFETLVNQYNYDKEILYNVLESVYASMSNVLTDEKKEETIEMVDKKKNTNTQQKDTTSQQKDTTSQQKDTTSRQKDTTSQQEITKCLYFYKRGNSANSTCDAPVMSGMVVCKKHIKFNDKYKIVKPKTAKKKINNIVIKNSVVYNNCKCQEDDEKCHNLDEMQVPEINKLYLDIFKTSHIDISSSETYKYDLLSEEIFLEKKKAIINYCMEKDIKIKATLTKLGQLDFNQSNLISVRHPKGAILKFVKYKLSKYWIDYTTRLIFKSPEDLTVIGRINRYEQPLLAIDGTAFDLILKHQFEYDESLLNENGKQAKEAFDTSCARYKQLKEAEKMLAEPSIQGNNIVL
jgi:hypothetical protein